MKVVLFLKVLTFGLGDDELHLVRAALQDCRSISERHSFQADLV